MKVAVVDFRDSFTYNIVHYLEALDVDCSVFVDGEFDPHEMRGFDAIILSPGPGLPSETASLQSILKQYHLTKPILGICLGMQGIAEFFGGKIYNLGKVRHGVEEKISLLEGVKLYQGLPSQITVGLYHSWACDIGASTELIPDAWSEDNVLMSLHHRKLPIFGVQFHPESIMTTDGKQILQNFVSLASNYNVKNIL